MDQGSLKQGSLVQNIMLVALRYAITFQIFVHLLTSWAFVLFGIDWILEIALASIIGIDSTTFLLPVAYDTKHLLPLLHS
jgi:hypothetical protein